MIYLPSAPRPNYGGQPPGGPNISGLARPLISRLVRRAREWPRNHLAISLAQTRARQSGGIAGRRSCAGPANSIGRRPRYAPRNSGRAQLLLSDRRGRGSIARARLINAAIRADNSANFAIDRVWATIVPGNKIDGPF